MKHCCLLHKWEHLKGASVEIIWKSWRITKCATEEMEVKVKGKRQNLKADDRNDLLSLFAFFLSKSPEKIFLVNQQHHSNANSFKNLNVARYIWRPPAAECRPSMFDDRSLWATSFLLTILISLFWLWLMRYFMQTLAPASSFIAEMNRAVNNARAFRIWIPISSPRNEKFAPEINRN